MSISGTSDTHSSNSGSLSSDVGSGNNHSVDNLSDSSSSHQDLKTSPSTEQLAMQPTTFDKLANSPTTLEQLAGLPATDFQPHQALATPVQLAQNGPFPGYVQQELQQQLQPVKETLDDLLTSQPGQPALDLISQHRETIIDAAEQAGIDPQQVASIMFQEKFHGVWADAKNAVGAWPQILAGQNDASIGLAEMDINTAARVMGIDATNMSEEQRDNIIATLSDDKSAISLIAKNIASFEDRLGRDVTLKEATYGHNAGIDALERDLPIERGSTISRRSWEHQGAIARALGR